VFQKVIGKTNEPGDPVPAPLPAPLGQRPPAPGPLAAGAATPVHSPTPAATRNILSSDVDIKGNVKFTNDLVVDGRIEGQIISEGNLTVGENARLKAEVKTGSVTVYGKVHGNIVVAGHVELRATAEVVGDIKAKTLSIEAGAIFVGCSEVGTPSSASSPAAAAGKAPAPAAQAKPATPQQGNLAATKP
jgi:cytoskeletal protein CcmA (bactofilin family)